MMKSRVEPVPEDSLADGFAVEQIPYSSSAKRFIRLTFLAYFVTTLLIPCIISFCATSAHADEEYSKFLESKSPVELKDISDSRKSIIIILLFHGIFTLMLIWEGMLRQKVEQIVKCEDSTSCNFLMLIMLLMILTTWLGTLIFQSKKLSTKLLIFFNCAAVVNFLWFLLSVFARRNCNCKTCRKIKDVKIWYNGECLEVLEEQIITREQIRSSLPVKLSGLQTLALQDESGKIVRTFEFPTFTARLKEGDFNLVVVLSTPGIHFRYLDTTKTIKKGTQFNEKMLKEFLHIETSNTIALEYVKTGKIVHTFYDEEEPITLDEGNYAVVIYTESVPLTPSAKIIREDEETISITSSVD